MALEPKGWSYQGLGNTLGYLRRFDEANEAYKKAVELEPTDSYYWSSWAWGLLSKQEPTEAIIRCEKAIALNPKNYEAWGYWGKSLELTGSPYDALLKYETAVDINPNYDFGKERIKFIENEDEE